MTRTQTFKLASLLLLFGIFISSCGKKTADPVTFVTYVNNVPFTFPIINTVGTPIELSKMLATINVDSILKAKNPNYATKNINSVVLNDCSLKLNDGDPANNMSNLKTISLYVSSAANTQGALGAHLPERIDQNTYEFSLPAVTGNVVTDYFNSNNFTFTLTGVPRRTSTKVVNGVASIGFRITVQE